MASTSSAAYGALSNGHANHTGDMPQGPAAAADPAAALQLLQEFLQVQSCRAEVYSRFNQGFRELLNNGQEAAFARVMHEVTPLFNAASQQVISIEGRLKSPAVNRPDLAALLRGVQEQERKKLKLTLSWQALRAAHAAGRFSWQEPSDRPRTQGAPAAAAQQAQQQQQQQLMAMLHEMQLQAAQGSTAAAAAAGTGIAGGCDVTAERNDQHAGFSNGPAAVKPGFYEQQMQRAVADALAATYNQQQQHQALSSSDSSHGAGAHAHVHGTGHCCGHGEEHEHVSDPLQPNNPLEPNEAEFKAAVKEALQELDVCVGSINEFLEEVREAVMDLQ